MSMYSSMSLAPRGYFTEAKFWLRALGFMAQFVELTLPGHQQSSPNYPYIYQE